MRQIGHNSSPDGPLSLSLSLQILQEKMSDLSSFIKSCCAHMRIWNHSINKNSMQHGLFLVLTYLQYARYGSAIVNTTYGVTNGQYLEDCHFLLNPGVISHLWQSGWIRLNKFRFVIFYSCFYSNAHLSCTAIFL